MNTFGQSPKTDERDAQTKKTLKDYFFIIIGSALGLGLAPIAPGTFGALLGVLFHLAIVKLFPANFQLPMLLFVFVLVCAGNNLLAEWAEGYWRCKDPGNFVLDEVAGYLVVPILFRGGDPFKVALWGFILFRVFDITKLMPPARYIDRNMHGGWGILLDDLVSGAYAALFIHIAYRTDLQWLLAGL